MAKIKTKAANAVCREEVYLNGPSPLESIINPITRATMIPKPARIPPKSIGLGFILSPPIFLDDNIYFLPLLTLYKRAFYYAMGCI